jgi:hypothetical protein
MQDKARRGVPANAPPGFFPEHAIRQVRGLPSHPRQDV